MEDPMESQNEDLDRVVADLSQGTKRKGVELDRKENKKIKIDVSVDSIGVNDLPPEIIGEHIFTYFDFINWIRHLSPVCRLWRQLAMIARVPKQFRTAVEPISPTLFNILTKFKVDTLIVKGGDLTHLILALEHAPYLHTLVLEKSIAHNPLGRCTHFKNITTFSVADHSSLQLLRLFPKLQRVHINYYFTLKDQQALLNYLTPNVKELEIYLDKTYPLTHLKSIVELCSWLEKIYVQCQSIQEVQYGVAPSQRKKFVCVNPVFSQNKIAEMSYHEYFCRTGSTKLIQALKDGNVKMLNDLLLSGVTREYDQDLKRREIPYKFPFLSITCPLPKKETDLKLKNIYKPEIKDLLVTSTYFNFWGGMLCSMEFGYSLNAFATEIKRHLPVPPYIPLKFAEHFVKHYPCTEWPQDILQIMLNATDGRGNAFLHFLPRFHAGRYLHLINLNAQNKRGENPATVAFNHNNFDTWLNWIKNGSELLVHKYKVDTIGQFLLAKFEHTDLEKISEIFLKHGEASGEPVVFTLLKYCSKISYRSEPFFISPVIDQLLQSHGETQIYNKSGRSFLNEFIRIFSAAKASIPPNSVKKLKEYGINFNMMDKEGKTPLTTAIEIQDLKFVFDLLKICKKDKPDSSGVLPFMQVLSQKSSSDKYFYGAVRNFLSAGCKLNQMDYDECGREMFPIGMAIKHVQPKYRIESLVSYGADLTLVDSDENNILHVLLLNENAEYVIEMIPYLAYHGSINKPNSFGETPIMMALEMGSSASVLTVPTLDPDTITSCVESIAKNWSLASVKNLLSDEKLRASLIARISGPDRTVIVAALKSMFKYEKSIRAMLGIRLNAPYVNLMRLFLSDVCLTKILLEYLGFHINTQNSLGETLLFHVNLELDNFAEITHYLLKNGINTSIKDAQGNTALEKFMEYQATPKLNEFLLLLAKHMGDKQTHINVNEFEESINYNKRRTKFYQKLPVVDVSEVRKHKQTI